MSHESTPSLALDRGPGLPFPELCGAYLREYCDKIRYAVLPLRPDLLWWRPGAGTNSVANLILHLRGNLSLWVLKMVGGVPFDRDRPAEFAASEGAGVHELCEGLDRVVEQCERVLDRLDPGVLARRIEVQGYDVDGHGALFHAVEHMSYHTGQILFVVKALMADARELELYPDHP